MKQNYYIMSKDRIAAQFIDGNYITVDESLEPLFLRRSKDFYGWLKERSIDSHRTNSRLLKRMLRLSDKTDEEVVLNVHAVTVTDTYWVKPTDSDLSYDDVRFKDNIFDMVALKGDSSGFDLPRTATPELTNIGSFEKCWKRYGNRWYMLKRGNINEMFSEVFISKLGALLGYNMAEYTYSKEFDAVKTRDFTDGKVNFEDAYGIVGNAEEDFMKNYTAFREISEEAARDYANMLYLDALCMNFDRHIHNYGILRDADSGKILGLAPNFDNNNALLVNPAVHKGEVVKGFISMYAEFFENENVTFTPLSTEKLADAVKVAYTKTSVEFDKELLRDVPGITTICKFVCEGNEYISKAVLEKDESLYEQSEMYVKNEADEPEL